SENKKTSTWDDESHDVIGDLLEWFDQYGDENGQEPDVILMSRETQALLLKNAIIIAEAGRPEDSTRANDADLTTARDGYGLPTVHVIGERRFTVDDICSVKKEI